MPKNPGKNPHTSPSQEEGKISHEKKEGAAGLSFAEKVQSEKLKDLAGKFKQQQATPSLEMEVPGQQEQAVQETKEAALAAEVAVLKEQMLRVLAESENTKKRAQKSIEDARKYAVTAFAEDLVGVLDSLFWACESIPDGTVTEEMPIKNIKNGVELTRKAMLNAFEKHGLKRIFPLGEIFDHNVHQAISQVEDATQPEGTVIQVMQAGYTLHGRLLKPAMVTVTKGAAG